MSFGKFYPACESKIGNQTIKKPSGYSGLFWGTVYDENNEVIENSPSYFCDLAEYNDIDTYDYWDILSNEINLHCAKYVNFYIEGDDRYHAQSGFGGDNCGGLIEFWSPVQIPEMPDLKFKIDDLEYTIKWEFSSGCD